jgi:selenium-dependent xanthine dehydrogenase
LNPEDDTPMRLTLNGRETVVEATEATTLLDVLRDGCGITSVKDGCAPEGSCGACTVISEGKAVVSCAQPASRFDGREVMTQQGLTDEQRRQWADCFLASGASQCGFCSPGIVMKAESFLAKHPQPERPEILKALAGNLCRCTGYVKIVDAIEAVARVRGGEPLPELDRSGRVGSRTVRYQGAELALGDKDFVNDMRLPGMVHGAIRWSDHPRARIVRIDTSRAERAPGVVGVATWRHVPGERKQGLIVKDWRKFVAEGEITSYIGDVLAVVAAQTRVQAREAALLVDVDYEVLEPITDPSASMAEGAPDLHEGGNVLSVSSIARGDVDGALASAAHVVTETFATQFVEHAFLEPESALAEPTAEGGVHFFSQGQGIWDDRDQVASFLALETSLVRSTLVSNGGAFGAKEDLNVQPYAALLALRLGRPVLVTLSRAESMRFHPKRHPIAMAYTAGCDAEGHLLAVRARLVGDTGAYASVGDKVLERAAGHACGAYLVPNVDIEAKAVYTNNPPAGAMRGFGANQANFAIEGMMDLLAEQVGIDGWEIRWRNALGEGDIFGTGQRLGPGVGLKKTLLAVKDRYRGARFGGIACGVKNTGVGNGLAEYGKAVVRVEEDGRLTLFHSWTEMGQGCHTALLQILCEEVGVSADHVSVVVDTERELGTGQTTASRSTVLGGRAVMETARKLMEELGDGDLKTLAGREFEAEVKIDSTHKPGTGPEGAATHFAYGWATQVILLDDQGAIERVIAAHDVGRIINPTLLEGQIEGGLHMGLGHSLSEDFAVEGGVPLTQTLKSLNIIPPAGMPPVECIFIEEHQPEGPHGAKGVGEIALVPTASALAGALHAFDGVRRTRLPMADSPAARAAVPRLAKTAGARQGTDRVEVS